MRQSLRFILTILVLGGTMAAAKFSESRRPDELSQHLESIPVQIADWHGTPLSGPSAEEETKLLETEHLSRAYRSGNQVLDLWIAYYAEQKAGESMHSPKNCLPGAGWEAVDYGFVDVPVEGRPPVTVNRYLVEKGGEKLQVLYWYQSKQRVIASEYTGKGFLVWDSILGRSTGGTLVRLTMPDRPGAVDEEIRFASKVLPTVDACLRKVPQS